MFSYRLEEFRLTEEQKSQLNPQVEAEVDLAGMTIWGYCHIRREDMGRQRYQNTIRLLLKIEDALFSVGAFKPIYLEIVKQMAISELRQLPKQTLEEKLEWADNLEKVAVIFQTASNRTSDEAQKRNFKKMAFEYCQEAGHLRGKLITEANYFSRMKELYENLTPTLPVFMQDQFSSNISLLEKDRPASSESPGMLLYRRRFLDGEPSTPPRKGGSEEAEPLLQKTPPGKEKFR